MTPHNKGATPVPKMASTSTAAQQLCWFIRAASAVLLIMSMSLCAIVAHSADVPFEVTPTPIVDSMLMLANVGPKSVVVDLGSGDGRIVLTAVQRFNAKRSIGVEADAALVAQAASRAKADDIASGKVTFLQGDFFDPSPRSHFREAIRNATVVTLYWIPAVIEKLLPELLATARPGTVVVSHDYSFKNHRPVAEWFAEGFQDKKRISGVDVVYLYKYVVGEVREAPHVSPSRHDEALMGGVEAAAKQPMSTVTKRCVNNICTFKIHHNFTAAQVTSYTVAYTQRFVDREDESLQWYVHVMVEDGKLRAMWLPGLNVSGGKGSDGGAQETEHIGSNHGPVHVAYRVRRLLPSDASSGVEGSGPIVARGTNARRGAKKTKKTKGPLTTTTVEPPLVDNLGLGDAPVPLSFTVWFDVLSVGGVRRPARPARPARGASTSAGDDL